MTGSDRKSFPQITAAKEEHYVKVGTSKIPQRISGQPPNSVILGLVSTMLVEQSRFVRDLPKSRRLTRPQTRHGDFNSEKSKIELKRIVQRLV